jgi:tyrosine-protein phosphatase YwqE
MWPFKKHPSWRNSGVFTGFTDWHSHILPGVDDGVHTMEESLDILHLYEQVGVSTVWLTPHIMEDIPNTTARLRARFEELKAAYTGPLSLHLAAENMLDNLFTERLSQGDLLPLGEQGTHLLVETSYFNPPMGLKQILEQIKARGYHPVLAHPERYVYMGDEEYSRLKAMDVKFQLNLLSLIGGYGKTAQKKAKQLLKEGMYNLAGSDLHALSQCRFLDSPCVIRTEVANRLKNTSL